MKAPIQRKSFQILIIFAAFCIVGISVIPMLRLQLNPSQSLPQIQVNYSWPGASPEILEQEVTTTLEGVFSTLGELSTIESGTSKNNAYIILSFNKKTNLEKTRFEIASLIRQTYPKLPYGVSYPQISMRSSEKEDAKYPLISYMFNGPTDLSFLKNYVANNIKNQFFDIKGISEIVVTGGAETAYELVYDQNVLNTLSLNKSDIETGLRNYFQTYSIGIGIVDSQLQRQINIRLNNQISNTCFWDDIFIDSQTDRIIRLTDICKINKIELPPNSYYRVNGLNTINFVFYPEKGINHLILTQSIKKRISDLSTKIPQKHHILLSYDSTLFISKELNKIIYRTIITIIILLLFVLIVSLSFRYLFIILLSLIVNIALSFSLYALLGIDIHIYSLAGITISLGLIIDNSIVMIDHIRNFRNKKVYLALLASTLTTIISLVIVLFLPDQLRLRLIDFSFIIIINLSVSLIIALWFIPALLERVSLRKKKIGFRARRTMIIKLNKLYSKLILLFLRWEKALILIAILSFGLPIFMLPPKLEGETTLIKAYNNSVGSDNYKGKIKPIVDKVLGGTLRLFVQFVYENSYYSQVEETKLYLRASMDEGIPISKMNDVLSNLEKFIATFPKIRQFTTIINSNKNANITIYFKPEFEQTSFPYILKSKLIQKGIDFGGMEWSIYGVGQGFNNSIGVKDPINYSLRMFGYNYNELKHQAEILKIKLESHPRIKNINIDGSSNWDRGDKLYQYSFDIDIAKLKLYDKSLFELQQYSDAVSLQNNPSVQIYVNEQREDVFIRSQQSKTYDKWQLTHNQISQNSALSLSNLTSITKQKVSSIIRKFDQQYIRVVQYQYNGNTRFGNRYRDQIINETEPQLPLGYSIERSQYSYWEDQNTKPYHLIGLIIIGILLISSILFESLKQPFAIIGIIPLSYIGIFITFYFFNLNFDQGGYASFILITGLTVNSAFYIINSFNTLKKEKILAKKKMSDVVLYLKAFNSKIIPVFLTIISSALGLVPFMMLGKNEPFWYAFSAGSIGGLVFSLFILIIYLPIFLLKRKNCLSLR